MKLWGRRFSLPAVISADSSSASPHRRLDFLSVMERGYNEFQEARPLYAQLVGGKHDPEKRARTVYRLVTIGGAAVGALALFGVVHQVSEYTQAQ